MRLDCELIADDVACEGPAFLGGDGPWAVTGCCAADGGGERRSRELRRVRVDGPGVSWVERAADEMGED